MIKNDKLSENDMSICPYCKCFQVKEKEIKSKVDVNDTSTLKKIKTLLNKNNFDLDKKIFKDGEIEYRLIVQNNQLFGEEINKESEHYISIKEALGERNWIFNIFGSGEGVQKEIINFLVKE